MYMCVPRALATIGSTTLPVFSQTPTYINNLVLHRRKNHKGNHLHSWAIDAFRNSTKLQHQYHHLESLWWSIVLELMIQACCLLYVFLWLCVLLHKMLNEDDGSGQRKILASSTRIPRRDEANWRLVWMRDASPLWKSQTHVRKHVVSLWNMDEGFPTTLGWWHMAVKLKGQEKHERLCRLQLTLRLPMRHFNLKTTNYIYS